MKTLYHPNALPRHIREQLPNPSRPIDAPVVPAMARLFEDKFDPIYQALAENFTQPLPVSKGQFPKPATVESVLTFLKHQQTAENGLTLADFVKNVRPLGQVLIEAVIKKHPEFYPNLTENHLSITTQFWQNLLALFLIAQCKTRKTLNPAVTLHKLSQQMNGYIAQHPQEIEFLTYDSQLTILPEHVMFAILALDGKISKKGEIAERITNLSANHFLTQFN